LVHSASPGDKWSTSPSPVVIQGWKFFRHTARAGDALFNYSFSCPSLGGAATSAAAAADPADSRTVVMLNMRTCTSFPVKPSPCEPGTTEQLRVRGVRQRGRREALVRVHP
jgi:hypothetical protein